MTNDRIPSATVDAYLDQAIGREPRAGVRLALDLLDQGVPSDTVIVDLLGAAQREVGERWLRDEWTVADEHLASGVTQRALDAVANSVEPPVSQGFVIVACAEGDWHSLPAQMFAEQLRVNGFAVAFLGASTPVDHVAKLIARHRPDALAVSCNLPLYFSGLARLVDAAHLQGVPVLGGGRALGLDPRRAIRLGADGWAATVSDAVTVLSGWQDRPPQLSVASTMLEPAALHLDASSASLAATAFDRLVVEFPRMTSYNDEQLARTREDLTFIVQFVAAARLVDDPDVLTQFLAWLGTLLGNRGVPPQALDAGLRVLAPLIGDLDPPAGEMVLAALAPATSNGSDLSPNG